MVVRREAKGYRTLLPIRHRQLPPGYRPHLHRHSSYFTADPRIGRDVAKLFNYITGYLEPKNLRQLVISPLGMRPELIRLMDSEIAAAKAGKPSGLWAKL